MAIESVQMVDMLDRKTQPADPVAINSVFPEVKDLMVKVRRGLGKNLKEKIFRSSPAQTRNEMDDTAGSIRFFAEICHVPHYSTIIFYP